MAKQSNQIIRQVPRGLKPGVRCEGNFPEKKKKKEKIEKKKSLPEVRIRKGKNLLPSKTL